MIINDLDDYYIVFDTKNRNIELDTLIICSSFVSSSWFKRLFRGDVWGKLGELSLYMYFIHLFVASVYWILKGKIEFLCYIQSGLLLILYLLAVVISAWLLKIVSEKIYNMFVG